MVTKQHKHKLGGLARLFYVRLAGSQRLRRLVASQHNVATKKEKCRDVACNVSQPQQLRRLTGVGWALAHQAGAACFLHFG